MSRITSTHKAFPIFFAGLQATPARRVNESPWRSSTSVDRTGRPITLCASHQLFRHTGRWDRTRLVPAKGPIMIEMFTRIIMCKLLRSCSQGSVTPSISCDRHTNEQRRGDEHNRAAISFRFHPPTPLHESIYCKKLNWPLKQHPGPPCCEDARTRCGEMREKTKK